ncbi:MAG TPA: hypothetical protein VJP60_06860 [Rhizomicrobium sp.]|nr:hypothetical protein [Rhizomicrobium sp.]
MKAASVLISVGMACSVAGCLGLMEPRDLASRKPFLDVIVNSPPEEVLKTCFSSWQTGRFRDGWSAWIQISLTEVHYLVDIMPASTGSHVVAYQAKFYDGDSMDNTLVDIKAFDNATLEERVKIEQRLREKQVYPNFGAIQVNECIKSLR